MYEFKRPRNTQDAREFPVSSDLAELDEDQLYTSQERVAICVIHGCVSEEVAQAIAFQQIRKEQQT